MDSGSTTHKTAQASVSGENQPRDGNHGLFRWLRRLSGEQARSAGRFIRYLFSPIKALMPSATTPQNEAWIVVGVENSGNTQPVSTPEIYSRLQLSHRHGYPLYHPEADLGLPIQYRRRGVSIGDVGIVTRDGTFDFLFNVCPSYATVNPRELPDDFELLQSDYFSSRSYLQPKRHLFSDGVEQINDSPVAYECSGPEGAVLELPKGAMLFEASDRFPFRDLAARHALNWYKYMFIDKARDASNGSLYLVTGCVKAKEWGIAVFDRPSFSQDYLRFVANLSPHDRKEDATYSWEMMGAVIAKIVSMTDDVITNDDEEHNQCLFLRGYKIMLREQIWDLLVKGKLVPAQFLAQRDTNQSNNDGQRGPPWSSDSAASLKPDPVQGVVVTEHFGIPLLHPSDYINRSLLQCAPGAIVALTHDDEWCTTLPDHFASSKSSIKIDELRKKVFEEYTHSVDKYGCVSLSKAQTE